MKVVLVGMGAREHAIGMRIAENHELYTIMDKNHPGLAKLSKEVLITPYDSNEIKRWVKEKGIELGFVAQDGLLAKGLTDVLIEAGVRCASPTKQAARLEWDKAFARDFMERNHIAGLPAYKVCSSDEEVRATVEEIGDVVVKPMGLTGGKGVKVMGEHLDKEGAIAYGCELLKKDGCVVIEERLEGEEFSVQFFCDGTRAVPMPPVQDHKRAYVGDEGPNTGGMGSYSTGPLLPFMKESDLEATQQIANDVLRAMKKEGTPFVGVLYAQMMATRDGVKVIEFNVRFGDPEAMNVLMLLEDDLGTVLDEMSRGALRSTVRFSNKCGVVKYAVPDGYPTSPVPPSPLTIDFQSIADLGVQLFYAAVYEKDGAIYSTTSRALALGSVGEEIEECEQRVERAMGYVKGKVFHRPDIGTKELIEKRIKHMKALRG